MKLRFAALAVLITLPASHAIAEPLRITIGDAIRMAIGEGTSSELARSAEQRARNAGTGTRLDVAQANVQLARARTALLVAQNERESARLALLNAIGADESADLVLADPMMAPTTSPDLDPSLARATGQRPELRQA